MRLSWLFFPLGLVFFAGEAGAGPPARLPAVDLDNDGLPDDWETANAALGVKPKRADLILVPVLRSTNTRAAVQASIDGVAAFYSRIPNHNADGSSGIHVSVYWGRALAPSDDATSYENLRAKGMPPEMIGRGHGVLIESDCCEGGQTSASDWSGVSNNWQTISHELGHQLGLDHTPKNGRTQSPFYASIMNYDYSYRFNGDPNAVQFSTGRFAGLSLNERRLPEVLPFSASALSFLASPPYRFGVRALGASSAQVDFNRNGAFGEASVQADVNDGYAVRLLDQNLLDHSAGAIAMAVQGDRLITLTTSLPRVPDWTTFEEPGASPSRPGTLRYQIREGTTVFPMRDILGSSTSGAPQALAAFGKVLVARPTGGGVAIQSFVTGSDGFMAETANASTPDTGKQPFLVRIQSPEKVYLFLWDPATKQVSYRPVSASITVGSAVTVTDPTGVPLLSNTLPGGTYDPVHNNITLVTTATSGSTARRLNLVRLVDWIGAWKINSQTWVMGADTVTTDSQPTILFDDRAGFSTSGGFLITFRREGSGRQNASLVRYVETPVTWWRHSMMMHEWAWTQSPPAMVRYRGDIAWGRRISSGKDWTNKVELFLRASGENDDDMGDFNDVAWILDHGLVDSLRRSSPASIQRYVGTGTAWQILDENPDTLTLAANDTGVYQLHRSGKVWRYTGGWEYLDSNPSTVDITAGGSQLYQRHLDGSVWRYTGTPCIAGTDDCRGWERLDRNPDTETILASGSALYQVHFDGSIWRYTGVPCNGEVCGGWQLLDNSSRTMRIAADGDRLYTVRSDGSVLRYTGTPCASASVCNGWQLLDANTRTVSIAATGGQLYQRHNNGDVWRFTGSGCSSPTSCAGWQRLDHNPDTAEIMAGGGALYQIHKTGKTWRYTGTPCTGDSCPGWQFLDSHPSLRLIEAGASGVYELISRF